MVVAILMETNTSLSDEVIEEIIDKERDFPCYLGTMLVRSTSRAFCRTDSVFYLFRHLKMLMLMGMAKSTKKNGRLLLFGNPHC